MLPKKMIFEQFLLNHKRLDFCKFWEVKKNHLVRCDREKPNSGGEEKCCNSYFPMLLYKVWSEKVKKFSSLFKYKAF